MNIAAVSQTKPICIVVSEKKKNQKAISTPCLFLELHQKKNKQKIHLISWTLLPISVQIEMWNMYIRRRVRTHSNGNNSNDYLSKVSLEVLCVVHDFTHKITLWNINMEMPKDIRQCIHRKTVTFYNK